MRLHVLRRRLRVHWRRKSLRLATVLAVLAAIVAVDAWLIAPLFDPRINGLPPDTQRVFMGEELRLEGFLPARSTLHLDVRSGLFVKLELSRVSLADSTRREWVRMGVPLPPDPVEIQWDFGQPSASRAEPESWVRCRSSLELAPEGASSALTLHLDQPASPNDPFPLRLTAPDGGLRLKVEDHAETGKRCRRLFRIGKEEFFDPRQLIIIVPAEETVDMVFFPTGEPETVEPFDLREAPRGPSLGIHSSGGTPLHVRSAGEAPSIQLTALRVAPEHLEVTYLGEGYARGIRAPAGTRPFVKLKRGLLAYPLWMTFLAAIHAALFGWLKATLTGRRD
ncbi:MAG: hypothetical protein GY719_37530 [bacterium]|nr:hypothetical protein [bacterium]